MCIYKNEKNWNIQEVQIMALNDATVCSVSASDYNKRKSSHAF